MNRDQAIKILLLEDDGDDYRLISQQLRGQQHHFVIDWAETAAVAIEKLGRCSFDVVLTDLNVPDSVGLATVSQLRQHCGQIPIIVLTSLEDDDVERDILNAGAQDYLVKGEFGGRAMARAIFHAVQRQQAINEVKDLLLEQEQSHQLLREQAQLLQKKNRRLRKLYKTAQEFVDNVSHDFRTPLTVIKDYIAIIREGMVGDVNSEQQEMLDKISVRADDLNNMIDDLLDVSKLESGLLGAWRRNVPLKGIMVRAESMLQQRAQVRDVELVVECEEWLPDVYCDAEKVGRVITNLAVNAIKFAGNDGRVRLWAESDPAGHQVVIRVSDNGPGIDKQSLDQIFQRFQQMGRVKSTMKGFGLGLNIAQQLCLVNLGELSVTSQIGKGSTFSFTIPVADPIEILRRWLTVQETRSYSLSVVEITVSQNVTPADMDEFDSFLNFLLRQDDLLFRLNPQTWFLVLAGSSTESDRWFSRAVKEFERTNQNRPFGPLPEYQAKTRYEWNPPDTPDLLLHRFETLLRQANDAAII